MQRDPADLIDLADLRGRYRGCAAVLGGGPSLPADLRIVPPDAVLCGVNQHALLLPLDYIVFQDPDVFDLVREHPAARITHHRALADIWSGIAPDFGFSGATAAWCLELMGFAPIILCGMDNYSGRRRYWHSRADDRHEMHQDPLASWIRALGFFSNAAALKAASGPLTEVVGVYESRNEAQPNRRDQREKGHHLRSR